MTDVVTIDDLHISFATDAGTVTAVDGVSLAVHEREVLAIVGESGSGKTVTARSILNLLPESATTRGHVVLSASGRDGIDMLSAPPASVRAARGRDAAMVFQEPSSVLNPVFTVGWQLAEGLRAHERRLSRTAARARAIEMLRTVGIPEPEQRVDHFPHQFSGGQKQRIVIAMALVLDPGVIIADEPTTALDVTVQAEILDLLRRCRDDFGASVLLITHNMGVVADLADRVAVMYLGKIVEQAPVAELFASPKHDYTKALLAAVPRIGDRGAPATTPATATTADAVVRAAGLGIRYAGVLGRGGFQAVRGVSFEVAKGEVLGLVGESGSGKTTIGRAIAGLTPVTEGSLEVLGLELRAVSPRTLRRIRPRIGFVFQDPATSFNPLLTVGDAIAEPLRVHRRELGQDAVRTRVAELLELVQLPAAYAARYPHELSGGQRQRASLARALALDPELLIADEPTSALDVSVQARVLDVFDELHARLGFAALFISHDLAVIDRVSDRVAVLYRGEIVEQGERGAVLEAPADPYTQRLLAALPVPDPAAQAARRRVTRP